MAMIPKSTYYALIRLSDRIVIAVGNRKQMHLRMKQLNAVTPGGYAVGYDAKLGERFN